MIPTSRKCSLARVISGERRSFTPAPEQTGGISSWQLRGQNRCACKYRCPGGLAGGVKVALPRNPNEIAPYKILPGAVDSIHKVVLERLELFSSPRKPLAQTLYPLDDSVWVNESSEPDVLTVSGLQRREHRRTGSDFFGFHPLGFNCCSSGDKEPHHFELSTVISGRRIAPAVDCPSQ